MDYYKDLRAENFNSAKEYMLELVKRGLDAGFDLEDIAEHYKEKVQQEASAIATKSDHDQLKLQIQKDLDNLAVINKTNTIVFPLELAGQIYQPADKNKYIDYILEKRLERRQKVNKLRESLLEHNRDQITEHAKSILSHDNEEEEAFTKQFKWHIVKIDTDNTL